MTFDAVLGNRHAVTLLREALVAGRLPHAILLHGPAGVGKATVARLLAGAILCLKGPEQGPCGKCAGCLKLEHGNHPDFFHVTRLPKKESASAAAAASEADDEEGEGGGGDLKAFIVVEQIRDVVEHAGFPPREGAARVFLIDPAERMNPNAQNALLKTLEEPRSRAVFLLVTARLHALLPTVRSRCLPVGFSALPVTELARLLEGHGLPKAEALTRAALSGGRPGAALALDPERLRGRREEILATLESMARGIRGFAGLPAATASLGPKDEGDFLEGLDLLESLLRDAALCDSGATRELLVHPDLEPRVRALGKTLGARRAADLVRSVERSRSELRFFLNKTLIAEALFAAVGGGPIP